MNDGQEAVGGERPKEEALVGLPVIDKLAAHGAVHALRSFAQIINLQRGPVFAEAVGENSVGALRAAEVDDGVSEGLNASNTLDCYRFAGMILYLGFDNTKSSPLIDL